jgi:hypothetical protein
MPINPVMPDTAPIEAEEYSEGSLQVETQTPEAPAPPAPPPPKPQPVPEPVPRPEPGEADTEPEDDDDEKASEAGKALAERKTRLDERKLSIQEQINQLVRERGEVTRETERGRAERQALQREIETLRGERERLGGAQTERPAAPVYDGSDPRDPEPVEGQFEDYAAYTKAVGRWAGRQEFRRGEYLRYQREQQAARQQWEAKRQQNYSTRYQAFVQTNPTFEQEINREDLLLTAPMVDAIKDSDVGPQMLLHLARHPEDIDRIAALHEVLAYGEMKKLEGQLIGAHSGSPPDVAQQHSQAPAPIKPVGHATSRRSDTDEIPGEDVSDDEHFERMNKRDEMLRKRGYNPRKGYGLRF